MTASHAKHRSQGATGLPAEQARRYPEWLIPLVAVWIGLCTIAGGSSQYAPMQSAIVQVTSFLLIGLLVWYAKPPHPNLRIVVMLILGLAADPAPKRVDRGAARTGEIS
jgi:hypothetical protein